MFPLNDTEPNRYSEWNVTTAVLIAVNTAILVWEMWLPDELLTALFRVFGSTPHLVLTLQGGGVISSLTHMFLHAGPMHLIGNMWALWVFGCRVEDACGHGRFLCYYLLCGLCADAISTLVRFDSTIPGIGASGALFGVMGAYLLLYPEGRIRTLVVVWLVPTFPKIRAFWVILYFMAVQIIPAMDILLRRGGYNVNYWAHLGGFFACLFVFLFLRPQALARYMTGEPV